MEINKNKKNICEIQVRERFIGSIEAHVQKMFEQIGSNMDH